MRRRPAILISDPEKVVTLEIDVLPDDVPPIDVSPGDKPPNDVPPQDAPGPAQRVLLLEDRDDFRGVLRDHLTFRGFQVTSVPSGVEGLREIRHRAFDLIICDMMMPQVAGEMFYWGVMRMRPATARRFIFFTGHRNNPAIEFFFKRVNATVLLKPFNLEALDSTIRDVLGKTV